MYVCHMYVAPTEARRSSDPLKVELEEVVSHPMGDGNKTRVLQKNTQHFEAQDCPSSPLVHVFIYCLKFKSKSLTQGDLGLTSRR